ncbi:glycine--tRNA ligase subunit beta [Pararhodobacter oceanensis]|uniref:glycine--tRNA ligase subunit beta n=1 Tax=Pararhodobacter oceanensis TaxID=2172121 RepID=UPI003A90CAB3
MPDVLIELFSEEIPARMQRRAAEDLRKLVTDGLVDGGLTYAHARAYATPRRLTLAIEGLSEQSPTLREERKGPKVAAPEKAIEGFLRSTGLTLEQLEQREDKKGAFYLATIEKPGRAAPVILAEVLESAIRNFPWPKSMRWGAGSLRWVRPLHSILCVITRDDGTEVVPFELDGITAGDTTRGHRFMAPEVIKVTGFEDYAAKLKRAFVVLDAEERAASIAHDIETRAFALGLELVEDAGLLAEVSGLVEWPVVLVGEIEEQFLDLPPEVLQTSMREHQKFFSLRDPKDGRIVRFVTVANRDTADQGATILRGNQKVLAARLADAKFFWENDLRVIANVGLSGMAEGLTNVTFHNKLGSQKARIDRISALAREIAPLVGADPVLAEQAAQIAKADLQSAMVGEFPELQGTMGVYYARAAGLPDAVANACKAHYQPLGPSDDVPSEPVSVAVALADKIDTLTGFWAIDEKPTGSKDPFALRRAALGVIRLVLGNGVRTNLFPVLSEQVQSTWRAASLIRALGNVPIPEPKSGVEYSIETTINVDATDVEFMAAAATDLLTFLHDRLKVYLRDQGIRHDVIDACLAMPRNDDLTLLVKRATALSELLKTEDGPNLLQGFKRANSILTQAEENDGVEYSFGADVKYAETDEERTLFAALDSAEAAITPAMQAEDFAAAMHAMAGLRAPIDAFFEAVQINTDSQVLRRNRLNLLSRIRTICGGVADFTKLDG